MKLYPAGLYPDKVFLYSNYFFVRDRDSGKDLS